MKEPKEDLKALLEQKSLELDEAWNEVRAARAKLALAEDHMKRLRTLSQHTGEGGCDNARYNLEGVKCPRCYVEMVLTPVEKKPEKGKRK